MTDPKTDMATRHPTGPTAGLRHPSRASAPYAVALLARVCRATMAARRPALRAWLMVWAFWSLAGWALSPLKATAETVRRLGPQNLGQRIGLTSGDDQFKELADAIDDALDRLAAGYESQRRFAANASHELRTPLAVQRLLTEVAMDDPNTGQDLRRLGAQLLRTNEHNEQLIEGMLTVAESDRGLQGKVPFRLDALAGRVIDQHAAASASASRLPARSSPLIRLTCRPAPPARWPGNRHRPAGQMTGSVAFAAVVKERWRGQLRK
jgi:signal transduction histidine kinase